MVGQPFEPPTGLVHLVDLRISVPGGREREFLPARGPFRGDVQARQRNERPSGAGDQIQLLNLRIILLAPAWSPDRRRLAFVTYRKGDDPQIEELDLVTGARRTLVALPGLNITPEWSPNGEELAFATTRDGNSEIYKVDKSGRRFERLTDHWAADLAPTWSPTGRELAFTSDRGGTPQIYLMSADGTNVRALTYPDRHGSYNSSAVWSPKGNWLAYVCRDERRILKICLISPDGQQWRQLTTGSSNDESPSWSVDGRHVVFSSTRNGRRDIYMINADGTGLERLTTGGRFNDHPAWSAS